MTLTPPTNEDIPFDKNFFRIMMVTCCAKPPHINDSDWKRLRVIPTTPSK